MNRARSAGLTSDVRDPPTSTRTGRSRTPQPTMAAPYTVDKPVIVMFTMNRVYTTIETRGWRSRRCMSNTAVDLVIAGVRGPENLRGPGTRPTRGGGPPRELLTIAATGAARTTRRSSPTGTRTTPATTTGPTRSVDGRGDGSQRRGRRDCGEVNVPVDGGEGRGPRR
jgi:hypothetical protein